MNPGARYSRTAVLVVVDLAAGFLAFNLAIDLCFHLVGHGPAPQPPAVVRGPQTAMYLGLPLVLVLVAWLVAHALAGLYRPALSVQSELLRLAAAQASACTGLFLAEVLWPGMLYSRPATLLFLPLAFSLAAGLRLLLRPAGKLLAAGVRRAGVSSGTVEHLPLDPQNVIELSSVSMRYVAFRSRRHTLREAVFRTTLQNDERVAVWALRDVSFTVKRGEGLGIIGPNGAGKSTLCLLLSKIMEPTSGTVRVDGQVSALLTLGVGFQGDLTGRDNIYLNGVYLGLTLDEIRARQDEIIAFAELADAIDMPVRTYSSGMRARLAFSIAQAVRPEILILDELMGVGDLAFQKKSTQRMKQLIAESKALVVVSHSMSDIRNLCSRAIWLERGRLVAEGPTEEVVSRYEQEVLGGKGKT